MTITKQKIIAILKEIGTPYSTAGKNITTGSVGIRCPFCSDDPSNHLGIMEGNGVFSCWRCRTKGPFVYLIQKLSGMSLEQCEAMVHGAESFKKDSEEQIQDLIDGESSETQKKKNEFTGIPQYFTPITPDIDFPLLFKYLKRRGISIDTVIKRNCGICRVGRYMNRMIVPVVFGGKVVSFQAADLTGMAELKYDTAPGDINEFLYGYDDLEVGGRIVVCEGILDAWRVGIDATSTFGTHCTDRQQQLILQKKPSELVFCYDGDYYLDEIKNRSIPYQFTPFVDTVMVVHFPNEHDPDSFGRDFGDEALNELINNAEQI